MRSAPNRDAFASDTNDGRSVASVVGDIVHNLNSLARAEARLAVAELVTATTNRAKGAGRGAAFLASGGILALLALAGLMAAASAGLALIMATWAAVLIVTAVVGAIALLAIISGVSQLKRSLDPTTAVTRGKEHR